MGLRRGAHAVRQHERKVVTRVRHNKRDRCDDGDACASEELCVDVWSIGEVVKRSPMNIDLHTTGTHSPSGE